MNKEIVIVGGGVAGLLSALILSNSEKYSIHVVEREDKLGGLLKAFDYGQYGKFDYGAHNILETGIEELDNLLTSLLEEDEWEVACALNHQRRTLTGLFYDGNLQHGSPFIDIRQKENIGEYIADFMLHFYDKSIDVSQDGVSAYDHSVQLFGKKIADEVITPTFLKLYSTHPKDMNNMAMYLTPMLRMVIFNQEVMDDLLSTKKISRSLSYPDQFNLPTNITSSLKARYPKQYGIYRVIDSLEKKLNNNGVKIHMNSSITDINIADNKIDQVSFGGNTISNIEYFIWSVNLSSLAGLLGIDMSDLGYDKNPKTVITNILIDKPLNMGELSYFYCYDTNFKTFRVDNYINYCSGAKRMDCYPVSIEMILGDDEIEDIEKIRLLALEELSKFGVLAEDTEVKFSKTEVLEYGFPLLSQTNIDSMNKIRDRINSLNIDNLVNIGILSDKNIFFEGDVKRTSFEKSKAILENN
jgi:protoporphyrinogen oxidase